MTERGRLLGLIADRINDRYGEIASAVPPARPQPCYWLHDDASESYCREHAIEARASEFGLGLPLDPDRPFYLRTDLEDDFYDGIGASHDGESEHSETCAVCGKQLAYVLTDYGLRNEVDYWLESPLTELTSEAVYDLDRMCLNASPHTEPRLLLDLSAVVASTHKILRACPSVPSDD